LVKEAISTELLRHAFTGVNIIPTVMLLLIQLYWLISALGFIDFDALDIDFDIEVEGAEGAGIFGALAVFINIGEVPFALVFSLMILNFWIIVMLMYFLPVAAGGTIIGLLLIPAFIASIFVTKLVIAPLKKVFKGKKSKSSINKKVISKFCILLCDLEYGRLGQAEISQNGASLVINVMAMHKEESFKKQEKAFIFKKDQEKDLYYVAKPLLLEEFEEAELL